MKGKNFLKVTGILMIIGGAISIVLGIVALVGTIALAALFEATSASGLGGLYASEVLVIVAGIVELIAGIKGVIACNAPQKAGGCIVWGAIVAVLGIISMVLGVVNGGDFSITTLLLNLVLPGLYIFGAATMKNQITAA